MSIKIVYANIHSIHLTAQSSDMYIGSTQKGNLTLGYGWGVFPTDKGDLSAAEGSGGTFYAIIAVYPGLDVAFAGFTNCGDGSAALNAAIKKDHRNGYPIIKPFSIHIPFLA